MTKQNEGLYNNYCNTNYATIWEAYDRPSYNKERAYEWCMDDARKHDGYDIRIPTRNTFHFTFAFRYMADGKERLRYHTPMNVYDFELEK